MKAERVVECDVLVVGGGPAGLTAAIEAAGRGARVVVASKGRAGRSGNVIVSGSQLAAVVPYESSEDSVQRHFEDTLDAGGYINDQTLLRLVVSEAGPRLLKLEEWGVPLLRSGGELVRRTPPGHSRPRAIPTDYRTFTHATAGLSIGLPLRATAERLGLLFLDDTPIIRLVLGDGEVVGALAVDQKGGHLLLARARSVVVAAGGAGQIYASTDNTRGICGDSYGLLAEAGATLKDMEFVQFYPCWMTEPFKTGIATPLFAEGAVLRNRHGERFMHLYDPVNGDMATRDVMSRAVFCEVQKGNGIDGEVYMDCTAVPESVLQTKFSILVRDLRKRGIDLAREWVKVGPTTHFFMGGAAVDARCFTGVPGLFAAGEAVGGVHGANRLSGNALAEAIVLGPVAGGAAADYACGRKRIPEPDDRALSLETAAGGGESLADVRAELRRAMWSGASIVRSEASLWATLGAVRECAAAIERCPASSVPEVALREETRLMCLTAEAVVHSALSRRESRGAHFREDYPEEEPR